MLSRIANILATQLLELDFISKLGGLVSTQMIQKKRVPVTRIVGDCTSYEDHVMVPDEKQRCIVYFEDKGLSGKTSDGRFVNFEANLRLVAWCNLKNIGLNDTTLLQTAIIGAIPLQLPSETPLAKISARMVGGDPKNPSIFSGYDFNEDVNFLAPPYDYFALNYRVKFSIAIACIPQVLNNPGGYDPRMQINKVLEQVAILLQAASEEDHLLLSQKGYGGQLAEQCQQREAWISVIPKTKQQQGEKSLIKTGFAI